LTSQTARLAGRSLLAGLLWGLLAYLLGHRAFGAATWGGVLAAPLIGLAIGLTIHPRFAAGAGWRRGAWTLLSVYLGAIGFGLSIACGELLARGQGGRMLAAVVMEPVVAILWGVTMTGYLLFLWPLAWFTHWLIDWSLES
jgi:hypothetical protein